MLSRENLVKLSIVMLLLLILSLIFVDKYQEKKALKTKDETVESTTENNELNDANDAENQEEVSTENLASPELKYYGDLHVDGPNLVDDAGEVVQLRGVSTHGINWYPEYINEALFSQIANETPMNVIRLAMYTEDSNGYLSGDQINRDYLLDVIDSAVNYATENDLYIIIDWHILSDSNPLLHEQEAVEFFSLMAEKYGDNDHVIFEICNEPNGKTTWNNISDYANSVIPAIREYSDNVILVGTPNYAQDIEAVIDHELDYENIMYTTHFYSATHKDKLRQSVQKAHDAGIPIFVSEFGVSDASGSGEINTKEAEKWLEMLDQNHISYVMWNLSNKEESSSIIKNEVYQLNDYTYEDLTAAGQWYFDYLTNEDNDSPDNSSSDENLTTTKDLKVKVDLLNSWQGGYQYVITIRNDSEQVIENWQIKLQFNEDVKLADSWNGEYQLEDNILTITPADYNSKLNPGEATGDIGFIINSDAELTNPIVIEEK